MSHKVNTIKKKTKHLTALFGLLKKNIYFLIGRYEKYFKMSFKL